MENPSPRPQQHVREDNIDDFRRNCEIFIKELQQGKIFRILVEKSRSYEHGLTGFWYEFAELCHISPADRLRSMLKRKYASDEAHGLAVVDFFKQMLTIIKDNFATNYPDFNILLVDIMDPLQPFYLKHGLPVDIVPDSVLQADELAKKTLPPTRSKMAIDEAWVASLDDSSCIDARNASGAWEWAMIKHWSPTRTEIEVEFGETSQSCWISLESQDKIAPFGTKTSMGSDSSASTAVDEPTKMEIETSQIPPAPEKILRRYLTEDEELTWRANIRTGSLLDVKDKTNTWYQAVVMEVCDWPNSAADSFQRFFRTSLIGFSDKFDEWIVYGSDKLAPFNYLSHGRRGDSIVRREVHQIVKLMDGFDSPDVHFVSRRWYSNYHVELANLGIACLSCVSTRFTDDIMWTNFADFAKYMKVFGYLADILSKAHVQGVCSIAMQLLRSRTLSIANPTEIREITKNDVDDVISSVEKLLVRTEDSSLSFKELEMTHLKFSSIFLQSGFLNRRHDGLKMLSEAIQRIQNSKESTDCIKKIVNSSSSKKEVPVSEPLSCSYRYVNVLRWVTEEYLCRWILGIDFIPSMFSGQSCHSSLMQRSLDSLVFLSSNRSLPHRYVELIWNSCIVGGMHEGLPSLAAAIKHLDSEEDLSYLIDQAGCLTSDQVSIGVLDLVTEVGKNLFLRASQLTDDVRSADDYIVCPYNLIVGSSDKKLFIRPCFLRAVGLLWFWSADRTVDLFNHVPCLAFGSDRLLFPEVVCHVCDEVAEKCPPRIEDVFRNGITEIKNHDWVHQFYLVLPVINECTDAIRSGCNTIPALRVLQAVVSVFPKDLESSINFKFTSDDVRFNIRSIVCEFIQNRSSLLGMTCEAIVKLKSELADFVSIRENTKDYDIRLWKDTVNNRFLSSCQTTINDERICGSRMGYLPHLERMLDFLQFYCRSSPCVQMNRDQLDKLWQNILMNAVTDKERDTILNWFSRMAIRAADLSAEDTERVLVCSEDDSLWFFHDRLSQEEFISSAHFCESAYNCVERYFRFVNARKDRLLEIPGRNRAFQLLSMDFDGIDVFWKIILLSKFGAVSKLAIKFLASLPSKVGRGASRLDNVSTLRASLLTRCKNYLFCVMNGGCPLEPNISLKSGNEPLINRLLWFIECLIEESVIDSQGRIRLHSARNRGRPMKITVSNSISNSPLPKRLDVTVYENDLGEDMISAIASELKYSPSEIKVFRLGREVSDSERKTSLVDIGVRDGHCMMVALRNPDQSAQANQDAAGQDASQIVFPLESLPSMMLASDIEFSDLLFRIVDTVTSQSVRVRAWDILQSIPTSPPIYDAWLHQIPSVSGLLEVSSNGCNMSLSKLLYSLQIVERLIQPAEDESELLSVLKEEPELSGWVDKFLANDGFECLLTALVNNPNFQYHESVQAVVLLTTLSVTPIVDVGDLTVQSDATPQISSDRIKLKCLCLLLKIISAMISRAVKATGEVNSIIISKVATKISESHTKLTETSSSSGSSSSSGADLKSFYNMLWGDSGTPSYDVLNVDSSSESKSEKKDEAKISRDRLPFGWMIQFAPDKATSVINLVDVRQLVRQTMDMIHICKQEVERADDKTVAVVEEAIVSLFFLLLVFAALHPTTCFESLQEYGNVAAVYKNLLTSFGKNSERFRKNMLHYVPLLLEIDHSDAVYKLKSFTFHKQLIFDIFSLRPTKQEAANLKDNSFCQFYIFMQGIIREVSVRRLALAATSDCAGSDVCQFDSMAIFMVTELKCQLSSAGFAVEEGFVRTSDSDDDDYDVIISGAADLMEAVLDSFQSPSVSSVIDLEFAHFLIESLLALESTNKHMNVCIEKCIQPVITSYRCRTSIIRLMTTISSLNSGLACFFAAYLFKYLYGDLRSLIPADVTVFDTGNDVRSKSGYSGIRNLGSTCYMNSLMQQMFMIPDFRHKVFDAMQKYVPSIEERETQEATAALARKAAEDTSTHNPLIYDDIIWNLSRMFSYIAKSRHRAFDPTVWVQGLKDETGEKPIDVRIQQDAHEYLDRFCDRLDIRMKNTDDANIVSGVFGGVYSSMLLQVRSDQAEIDGTLQRVFAVTENRENLVDVGKSLSSLLLADSETLKDHPTIRESTEPFSCVSVQVQNNVSLEKSLATMCAGDKICDFQWEDGKPKVDILKGLYIKSFSDTLIFHLKRFELNFDTFTREKLNNEFKFPMTLDIFPYTRNGFMNKTLSERFDAVSQFLLSNSADDVDKDAMQEVRTEFMENLNKLTKNDGVSFDYELVGIVVHMGTAFSGHYFSYIKERQGKRRWIEFNDGLVKPFSEYRIPAECFGGKQASNEYNLHTKEWVVSDVESSQSAYMLVYQRKIPESVLLRHLSSEDKSSDADANLLDFSDIERVIPEEFSEAIATDNANHMLLTMAMDPNLLRFTGSLMEKVQTAICLHVTSSGDASPTMNDIVIGNDFVYPWFDKVNGDLLETSLPLPLFAAVFVSSVLQKALFVFSKGRSREAFSKSIDAVIGILERFKTVHRIVGRVLLVEGNMEVTKHLLLSTDDTIRKCLSKLLLVTLNCFVEEDRNHLMSDDDAVRYGRLYEYIMPPKMVVDKPVETLGFPNISTVGDIVGCLNRDINNYGAVVASARIISELTTDAYLLHVADKWRYSDEICKIWNSVCDYGYQYRHFLVARQMMVQVLELLLGDNSPACGNIYVAGSRKRAPSSYKTVGPISPLPPIPPPLPNNGQQAAHRSDASKLVSFDLMTPLQGKGYAPETTATTSASASSQTIPDWGSLLDMFSKLVVSCKNRSMVDFKRCPPTLMYSDVPAPELDDWSERCVKCKTFYSTALKQARYWKAVSLTLRHTCFDWVAFCNDALDVLCESLTMSSYDNTAHVFEVISAFLSIEDSLCFHKCQSMFSGQNSLLDMIGSKKDVNGRFVCVCLRSIITIANRNDIVTKVLKSTLSNWAPWCLKFGYQFIQKCEKEIANSKQVAAAYSSLTQNEPSVQNRIDGFIGPLLPSAKDGDTASTASVPNTTYRCVVFGETEEQYSFNWNVRAVDVFTALRDFVTRCGRNPDEIIPIDTFVEVEAPIAQAPAAETATQTGDGTGELSDEEFARRLQQIYELGADGLD